MRALLAGAVALAILAGAPTLARADERGATLPVRADVGPMRHIWQTLNNCGPAAVVMALSTFGIDADQEIARLALRGPDVRRGMGPGGVDPWVRERYELRSVSRMNGTVDLLKHLLASGFAPMVTQWLQDPSVSRIAHWRTLRGYDDALGVFYVNDSMLGDDVPLDYRWFEANWMPFSYRWMVIYDPQDESRLRSIVGRDWSESVMRDGFYARAKAEALRLDTSPAWLSYGEAAYQDGRFDESVAAFERGIVRGSPNGVFTVRTSYPLALRALGRDRDADAAFAHLAGTTATPATVLVEPDGFALMLAARRATPFDASQPRP